MQIQLGLENNIHQQPGQQSLIPFRVSVTVIQGIYYGYPVECIEAFVKMRFVDGFTPVMEDSPYNGTGYRPCKAVLALPVAEVVRGINERRYTKQPFKLSGMTEEHHECARNAYFDLYHNNDGFKRTYNAYIARIRENLNIPTGV